MSMLGLLPQRWRTRPGDAHDAEMLAGILETRPVVPAGSGLVLCAGIGSHSLLPFLVAAKSLHGALGRGRFTIVDDGTLTGSDRTTIAHHLGDPPIATRGGIALHGLPAGQSFEPLLAALDGRTGEYWLVADPHCVTLGPVPEIARAIAANRSLHGPGIFGLAAGGPGRPDTDGFLAALDEQGADARDLLLRREASPVALPEERYRANPAKKDLPGCAVAAFGKAGKRAAAAHGAASRIALAALGS